MFDTSQATACSGQGRPSTTFGRRQMWHMCVSRRCLGVMMMMMFIGTETLVTQLVVVDFRRSASSGCEACSVRDLLRRSEGSKETGKRRRPLRTTC